LGSY